MGRSLVTGLIALLFLYSAASGAVLRVEKDGSGDYTAIQPAVDNASPGDTILVGPGRYTEHQLFAPSGQTSFDTYVAVTVDSLTIKGTDRDMVIIGPEVPNIVGFDPNGVLTSVYLDKMTMVSLTIENVYGGVYSFVGTQIENCVFRDCGIGIMAACRSGLIARNCQFIECLHDGIAIAEDTPTTLVENCDFGECSYGIAVIGAQYVLVMNSRFQYGVVGIQFESGATGTVEGCQFFNQYTVGINAYTGSIVGVYRNHINGGQTSMHVSGFGASISGESNVMKGGSYATVWVNTGRVDLHKNHILYDGGYLVRAGSFVNPPDVILNFQNNYWGIADRDSIAELIYDGHDDPSVHAFVDFDPFSTTPLPAEQKSLGSVKNLYR